MKSALTEFQDSLEKMQKDEAFDKRKVDIVGKEPPFAGSATKDAISGSYDVAVKQLAKSRKPIWPLLRLIPNLMPVSWILLLVEKAFPLM